MDLAEQPIGTTPTTEREMTMSNATALTAAIAMLGPVRAALANPRSNTKAVLAANGDTIAKAFAILEDCLDESALSDQWFRARAGELTLADLDRAMTLAADLVDTATPAIAKATK